MIYCRINGTKYRCDFKDKVVLINEDTNEYIFVSLETKTSELSKIIKDMENL